ncbi:Uu.00g118080.m01.CDS01 [Anthostomella pinea]|uniref:Uu.00g118080.m01.CDS01 n=1 Tax=Anthostomella pinea TaxID=933095 RepID=A0AAI8VGA7_9PEZI|nr:Uu.00g118080.m01.CDS01 [Anthostomella pinea]
MAFTTATGAGNAVYPGVIWAESDDLAWIDRQTAVDALPTKDRLNLAWYNYCTFEIWFDSGCDKGLSPTKQREVLTYLDKVFGHLLCTCPVPAESMDADMKEQFTDVELYISLIAKLTGLRDPLTAGEALDLR